MSVVGLAQRVRTAPGSRDKTNEVVRLLTGCDERHKVINLVYDFFLILFVSCEKLQLSVEMI